MKHKYFFRFCFFLILPFPILSGGLRGEAFAQTAWIDTNYIKAFVDSCKTKNTNKEKIICGNELLKLIQLDNGAVKTEKEKKCLAIAEANSLRNIGNAYHNMGMTS